MKSIFILLPLLAAVGCTSTTNLGKDPYSIKADRIARVEDTAKYRKITITRVEGIRTSVISFNSPKKDVVNTNEISNYQHHTYEDGKRVWSGGGIYDGFIFTNKSFRPFYIEIHALELGDCNCHHVFPYFANGRYMIQIEGEQD
jgi:outer membrane lipoprotein-sorting protein